RALRHVLHRLCPLTGHDRADARQHVRRLPGGELRPAAGFQHGGDRGLVLRARDAGAGEPRRPGRAGPRARVGAGGQPPGGAGPPRAPRIPRHRQPEGGTWRWITCTANSHRSPRLPGRRSKRRPRARSSATSPGGGWWTCTAPGATSCPRWAPAGCATSTHPRPACSPASAWPRRWSNCAPRSPWTGGEIEAGGRGAQTPTWRRAREPARQTAFAEDRAIFDGYPAAGINGIRPGSSNPPVSLPEDVREYPAAVARALGQLRESGVDGPYCVLLSADAYVAVSETSDHGYPVLEPIRGLVRGEIIWAPAISGAVALTTRGGDFSLRLGQEASIGYLSHTATEVQLYLQETLTFLTFTAEASVSLPATA